MAADTVKYDVTTNFDENNIEGIISRLQAESSEPPASSPRKTYTMLQDNSYYDVEITDASRDICTQILVR